MGKEPEWAVNLEEWAWVTLPASIQYVTPTLPQVSATVSDVTDSKTDRKESVFRR